MDGAADEPIPELGSLTPLEKAHIPHTDWIAQNGCQGLVNNVPQGYYPGSDVALMSVFGYDPAIYYTGRAPLEAAAQSIATGPRDLIFRCNLVTIADGIMKDYSAGHIATPEAERLINDLNNQLAGDDIRFYSGVGYRHLLVWKGIVYDEDITPPHNMLDQSVEKKLPRGRNGKKLVELMEKAAEILSDHEVNKVRADLSENPASHIWLWGQGFRPQMDSFRKRFGINASTITAVDLIRGLARLTGMKVVEVDGATGYLDTNYIGKGQAAIECLKQTDLVIVHVEAPDEAGHGALMNEKIAAIESIDEHIVGPVLHHLQSEKQPWRILVLPDHPTPLRLRTHTADPVPFALAGAEIANTRSLPYSERNARDTGLSIAKGHNMMEFFLKI